MFLLFTLLPLSLSFLLSVSFHLIPFFAPYRRVAPLSATCRTYPLNAFATPQRAFYNSTLSLSGAAERSTKKKAKREREKKRKRKNPISKDEGSRRAKGRGQGVTLRSIEQGNTIKVVRAP